MIVEFRAAAKYLLEEQKRLSADLAKLESEKTQLKNTTDLERAQSMAQITALRQEVFAMSLCRNVCVCFADPSTRGEVQGSTELC